MRIAKKLLFIFSLSALLTLSLRASTETLAVQAVSGNSDEARTAVGKLREMKQAGLDALFEKYGAEIRRYSETGEKSEQWRRIAAAIDNVAMQKDAYASRLFWLTDLEEAKRISKETGKPILSLRLLGNLNEEFSCANSRFFRAVLYPNAKISEYLRTNYILHWQSVRPAPRITIDFGDGRKIERTVTGNSIHYVLDENGRVIDALPGLNSPEKFLNFLSEASNYSRWLAGAKIPLSKEVRDNFLERHRSTRYTFLSRTINRVGRQVGLKFDTTKKAKREFEEMPPAMIAAAFAATKSIAEVNILRNITPDLTRYGDEQINLEQWKKIAELSQNTAKLDDRSINFIRHQTGKNNLSEERFKNLMRNLEDYISVDTARNEFLMRLSLLVWLNKGLDKDVEKLNEKVYSELFLTPNEDKWLGLYAPDIYTGLDGNGIR